MQCLLLFTERNSWVGKEKEEGEKDFFSSQIYSKSTCISLLLPCPQRRRGDMSSLAKELAMKCKAGSGSWRRRSPLKLLKCPGPASRKAANRAVIMGQLDWRLFFDENMPLVSSARKFSLPWSQRACHRHLGEAGIASFT